MIYFNQFMNDMSFEYDLHKDIDGTICTMSIVLPQGTPVTVSYDEINTDTRPTMRSGTFVAPIDRHQRNQFMQYILHFNRNSLSLLSAGFVVDPLNRGAFAPIWYLPKYAQEAKEWRRQINQFEGLINLCSGELRKMMDQWTANYLH